MLNVKAQVKEYFGHPKQVVKNRILYFRQIEKVVNTKQNLFTSQAYPSVLSVIDCETLARINIAKDSKAAGTEFGASLKLHAVIEGKFPGGLLV